MVGIAGHLEFKDESLIKRLLVFDYFRGPDSTGLASVSVGGEVLLAKAAGSPISLFDTKTFDKVNNGVGSVAFIGHNRLATKGGVNDTNAHPFVFPKGNGKGYIVGAHNGTLDNASWKDLEKDLGQEFNVDSQALIASIAEIGVEKTIPKVRGAWALTWVDTELGTLNFLRNKERPFWVAYGEKNDKVYWASEYPILAAALDLSSHFEHKAAVDEKGYRFYSTETNLWYSYNLADFREPSVSARPKAKAKKVEGKEPLPPVSYYQGGVYTGQNWWEKEKEKKEKEQKDKQDKNISNVFPIHGTGTVHTPFGSYVTKEEFEDIARYGCSFCGSTTSFEDEGILVYKRSQIVLCKDCAKSNTGGVNRLYL